jgi:biopolymer transport protein ExbD
MIWLPPPWYAWPCTALADYLLDPPVGAHECCRGSIPMSKNRQLKKGEEKTDINISPMIDMVFILLIFFIVTTVFVEEQGIDVDKPVPSVDPKDDDKDEPVLLRVNRNNQVTWHNEVIGIARVELIVRNALAKSPDLPVILQVERGAVAGTMIQVMDKANIGGAKKISVTEID